MSGFIAISRKIFDNPVLKEPEYFRAWVWLLSEARWKSGQERIATGRSFSIINLERGQLTHSRRFLCQALNMTEQRIRTFLNHLKINEMINLETNQGQMIITICKYNDYQIDVDEDNQQTNPRTNQRSTSDQPRLNKGNKEIKEVVRAREGSTIRKIPTVIPEGFEILEAMAKYANDRGFTGVNLERVFERFCNHHKAKGSKFIDWQAAWRTWVSNQVEFDQRRNEPMARRRPDV